MATCPRQVRAQQVLVQANVADDTIKTTFGANRRYFGHLYLGYGLLAGSAGKGAAVRYGLGSSEVRVGGRLKFRLTQALAFNLDLGYAYGRYELAQNEQKVVPSPVLHIRETLGQHQVFSEASLRFNAGRRGNSVGRYLDLLAGCGWLAATNHVTKDEPAPGISSVETTESGLPYLRRWTGGVGVRLGIDRYALVSRYRFSTAFSDDYAAWPELPRWLVGIEVGLF
ncbi:hypothetical protein I2I05_09605 [Hymenobacter sp. BT683]|uniref:PorT family protein n=1 Tax=Hymenobacter jeongseonensis TaxID=2791027 RepID=A0ABS0IHW7_9BACT|nr:hypothetical protein [Hymenobacter jeongseonensis]MBF9237649.1 hypothetical protein [Hymenobacter jeongseonensis]